MAAFFDTTTGRSVRVSEDHVLKLLGNGCDSDIEEFEDQDEDLEPTFVSALGEDHDESSKDSSEDEVSPEDDEPSAEETRPSPMLQEHSSTTSEVDVSPVTARSVPRRQVTVTTVSRRPIQSRRSTTQPSTRQQPSPSQRPSTTRQPCTWQQPRTRQQGQSRHGGTWKNIPFCDKPHEYETLSRNSVRSPSEYLNDYFNDDFYEKVANCTNLYYMRKTGIELRTTSTEIAKLFGIHVIMGCIPYPRLRMYWQGNINLDLITNKITRDRFLTLRNALHVVDHDIPTDIEKDNPLWKVQPMISQVQNACYKLERVPSFYSIDEQMIPFTGRCGLRQVVKNKPRPVGLKNFVVTTSDGLMLDFAIYKGAKTMFEEISLGLGPSVILHLIQSIPPGSCIYHDRYFTTVPLIEEMHRRNFHSTGTIMHNRIPDRASLKFKKDSEMVRGESQHFTRDETVIVKWKDSKSVLMASNCTGPSSATAVRRWDKKTKRYIEVPAPKVIQHYNKFMGGVDILDQQMEYYRTFIKTKKWTLKVLIHFLDLALVNSWRLYKNDCVANGYPKKSILPLLDFRLSVADTLTNFPNKKRLNSDNDNDCENEQPPIKRQYKPQRPSSGKRYDGYDHLPEFDDIKAPRSCMSEQCTSRSKIKCSKCNVYLCVSRKNNCFMSYHQQ